MVSLPLTVSKATACFGNVRQGYGLQLTISGSKKKDFALPSNSTQFYIDFHGNYWDGLPPGASSLAQWILPLKITHPKVDIKSNSNTGELSFILGAKGLSHGLLLSGLSKLKEKGDPPLMVEIYYSTNEDSTQNLLSQGVFYPSKLHRVLTKYQNNLNILSDYPVDNIPRRTNSVKNIVKTFRWIIFPLMFIMLCWYNFYCFISEINNPLLEYTPPIITRLMETDFSIDFTRTVMVNPTSLNNAWRVGYLTSELKYRAPEEIPEILNTLSNILKRDIISFAELDKIPQILEDIEKGEGVVTRFMGFFTFINIIWLLAIVGITISIGPSIYVLLKPLRNLFVKFSRWIYYELILPTARFCHEWGIFEAFAWLIIFSISLDVKVCCLWIFKLPISVLLRSLTAILMSLL